MQPKQVVLDARPDEGRIAVEDHLIGKRAGSVLRVGEYRFQCDVGRRRIFWNADVGNPQSHRRRVGLNDLDVQRGFHKRTAGVRGADRQRGDAIGARGVAQRQLSGRRIHRSG